ncbi:MAG: TolC family protein [Saprospiraceae bacterium]|nr:TolC family protein [Saprospiraceae bacterium]
MINRSYRARFIRLMLGLSFVIPAAFQSAAQSTEILTIEDCYAMARANFPQAKQLALFERSADYSIDNLSKGFLPQIQLIGQASYQSAVTEFPLMLPNVEVPTVSKDQYKIYADIYQPLTEKSRINQQKELVRANTLIEENKVEVELYKLKERINQLYFGILLIDAQLDQVNLLKKDIENGIDRINAAIANGVALKYQADILQAEYLKANQRSIELKNGRAGFLEMLSLFINQPLNENTSLEQPENPTLALEINRPELELFRVQGASIGLQQQLVDIKKRPKLGIFAQAGYGRPALNFLNNDFDFYYVAGLRVNWNLSAFYTSSNEQEIIALGQNVLQAQQETFLLQTNITLRQQQSEISKLTQLIESDQEIIQLQEKIKTTANNQLANGTITVRDYISYVNEEDKARQNLLLHQMQLLLAQYNYKTTSGN